MFSEGYNDPGVSPWFLVAFCCSFQDFLKNMNVLYKANQELAGIARDILASVVGKKEESDRVVDIVKQYTTVTSFGILKFALDGV